MEGAADLDSSLPTKREPLILIGLISLSTIDMAEIYARFLNIKRHICRIIVTETLSISNWTGYSFYPSGRPSSQASKQTIYLIVLGTKLIFKQGHTRIVERFNFYLHPFVF